MTTIKPDVVRAPAPTEPTGARRRGSQIAPARLPIELEIGDERVRKIYHRDLLGPTVAEARFARERAAYLRFNEVGTPFVPRLLDHDRDGLWLEIERVANGRTVIDWLEDAADNSFEPVITQLLRLDKYLYRNRINYLGGSPKDVLVAQDYRLYLIDFEYTWLDERFEDILCDNMIHARLARVANHRNRDLFVAMLAGRQREIAHFARRKIANAMARRLRVGRGKLLLRR